MPDEPFEEKVMAAIADRLTTIQAGAQYWTTPIVDPALLSIDQYKTSTAFPRLGVEPGSGSTFEAVSHDRRLYDVRITVWGYVWGDSAVPARTQLNRLSSDVRTCLLADRSLGGLVQELEPEGGRDTDEGLLEPLGVFQQSWRARAVAAVAA